MKSEFWNALLKSRKETNISIARNIQAHPATISEYFNGKKFPSAARIEKICNYLAIPVDLGKKEFINSYKATHEGKLPSVTRTDVMPFSRKRETFWQKIFDDSGMTNSEIAKIGGIRHRDTVPMYSSGALVPNDEIIRKLCQAFGVEYNHGRQEFIDTHHKWNEKRNVSNKPKIASYDTFWGRLKGAKGYNLSDLAEVVGVSQPTITQYMKGDGIPTDEGIKALCELFNVNFTEGKKAFIKDYQKRHPGKVWHPRDKNLPKPPPNKGTRTYKDNFWSRKRIEKGLSGKEIADALGVNCTGVYNWFTGRNIPSDDNIRKLCELFEVDYKTGKQEFFNAHNEWYSWKHDDKKVCKFTQGDNVSLKASKIDAGSRALKLIYGNIPQRLYQEVEHRIVQGRYKEVFRFLYGNIDVDTCYEVMSVLLYNQGYNDGLNTK